MADKCCPTSMMKHKITPSILQITISGLKQLNEPTYQNSIKVPKFVIETNKKTLIQNFRVQCNRQPNVLSLEKQQKSLTCFSEHFCVLFTLVFCQFSQTNKTQDNFLTWSGLFRNQVDRQIICTEILFYKKKVGKPLD